MTKIQETLAALPEEKKALFVPVFGDVDKFYTVVYLIARNEHVTDLTDRGITDWGKIKTEIKDSLGEFVWKKTKRRPMIIPIIMEV